MRQVREEHITRHVKAIANNWSSRFVHRKSPGFDLGPPILQARMPGQNAEIKAGSAAPHLLERRRYGILPPANSSCDILCSYGDRALWGAADSGTSREAAAKKAKPNRGRARKSRASRTKRLEEDGPGNNELGQLDHQGAKVDVLLIKKTRLSKR